ncbi:hypothetical protein ACSIGC_14400 [Tenacibaculum sp. ZS6-P6]|uniref:hypothetical protein n=1 Tax=Tenacibaculum sp. ZS6-P6 TaxID=3447503 RepID=UPI003F9CF7E9
MSISNIIAEVVNEYLEHKGKLNLDYLIEDILQRAFIDEALEVQEPKLKVDSYKILESKKGEVDVEEYKKMFAKMRKKRKKKKKSKK